MVDSVKMSVEHKFILARFKEHVQAIQTIVNTNVKWIVIWIDVMAKILELFESGRLISRLDHSAKFFDASAGCAAIIGFIWVDRFRFAYESGIAQREEPSTKEAL